jgi:hypothetical protein
MSRIFLGSLALITLAMGPVAAQEKTATATPAWVEGRILEILPTAADRKFDQIAWVSSIKAALRLAKEHGRPVMMFTFDGQVNTGRC